MKYFIFFKVNLNQITSGMKFFFLFHFLFQCLPWNIRWPVVHFARVQLRASSCSATCKWNSPHDCVFLHLVQQRWQWKFHVKPCHWSIRKFMFLFLINFWVCFETRINLIYKKIIKNSSCEIEEGEKFWLHLKVKKSEFKFFCFKIDQNCVLSYGKSSSWVTHHQNQENI